MVVFLTEIIAMFFCLNCEHLKLFHVRDKTHQILKAHENDPAIRKLRWNERLSKQDVDALEKLLLRAGTATAGDLRKTKSGGDLGLFVRSIVGLDRQAAKRAFDGFLTSGRWN